MAQPLVNAQVLEAFLQRLGLCFHFPASLYLVGGSSLLLVAGKTSTFDIDVQFATTPEHHAEFIRCLRTVSREMGILVELASTEQFIPLPAGFPGEMPIRQPVRIVGCFSLRLLLHRPCQSTPRQRKGFRRCLAHGPNRSDQLIHA